MSVTVDAGFYHEPDVIPADAYPTAFLTSATEAEHAGASPCPACFPRGGPFSGGGEA